MRPCVVMTAVPITDAEYVDSHFTRITLADGRTLTMKKRSVEIVPGHALIPARFADKIGAIPNNKDNLHPAAT